LDEEFHPRQVVPQMRWPMGVGKARGADGLANMHPHCWLRSLGRWLHHVTLSQSWGPGTADGRGRRCKKDLAGWQVGPDTLDRRMEEDVHPRRVVLQIRRPMALLEAGIGGLANIHSRGWRRSLGRWLHLEKYRNHGIHRWEELDEAPRS